MLSENILKLADRDADKRIAEEVLKTCQKMIEFKNIEAMYFVGIGGIGMSALALYFAKGGYTIAGYDRSESRITHSLVENGCTVTYEDDINYSS